MLQWPVRTVDWSHKQTSNAAGRQPVMRYDEESAGPCKRAICCVVVAARMPPLLLPHRPHHLAPALRVPAYRQLQSCLVYVEQVGRDQLVQTKSGQVTCSHSAKVSARVSGTSDGAASS